MRYELGKNSVGAKRMREDEILFEFFEFLLELLLYDVMAAPVGSMS